MASGDFDTPQIALLVGMPDAASKSGNLFSHSSPLFDSSLLPTSPSPSYIHGSPCPPTPSPTPMLRSAQCSLGSIRWATSTALCDHNLEERVGSPSYLSQNLQDGPRDRRRRTGNSTERKTERATGYDRSLSRAAPPDWTATLTRTVHVASQDSGTGAGSRRPSFVTSFFRRTVRRVRRPSLESDTGSEKGSDTAQNGGQKGFNVNVSRKGTQLARQYSDLVFLSKAKHCGQSRRTPRGHKEVTSRGRRSANVLRVWNICYYAGSSSNRQGSPVIYRNGILRLLIFSTPAATSTGQCCIQRGELLSCRDWAVLRGIEQILERGDSPCR